MRRTRIYILFALVLGGCVIDVADEIVYIHASKSGKNVSSVSFVASLYRHSINVEGGSDTLIADISLALAAHSNEQAQRSARSVSASWTPGTETGLVYDFGNSDKELISFDGISSFVPASAYVLVDGATNSVSVSKMKGDVRIYAPDGGGAYVDARGSITVETNTGGISGACGHGGSITTQTGTVDLSVDSSNFGSMSITRRSSCGDEVKLAIASGAKIHFKLSTDSGSISVHYDNVSYSTSGFHTGNGDDFETGSGKEVNVSVTDGDIIITNK